MVTAVWSSTHSCPLALKMLQMIWILALFTSILPLGWSLCFIALALLTNSNVVFNRYQILRSWLLRACWFSHFLHLSGQLIGRSQQIKFTESILHLGYVNLITGFSGELNNTKPSLASTDCWGDIVAKVLGWKVNWDCTAIQAGPIILSTYVH